ncbi:sulfatase [Algoriphagus sediminis]|uniref:Sulfatase n=1 Tax=Algoriphagus sediminis TaxID=3057113 RepID=A0ABT7YHB9_9BACT|nr:sulfatase [Algoriphagus sediminis]MDN3205913.1 sulfatase [Algoriphagus sediminis]
MRRLFLGLITLFLWHFSYAQIPEKFNIVLIHVDDLGWTDIGALGSDFYDTPNIDRLAEEGVLFTNSYAAAAICSPTRAALLTGKYPANLGITDWIRAKFQGASTSGEPEDYEEFEDKPLKTPTIQGFLPLEEKTIAEYLKPLGYRTLHVGKWHLGEEGFHPEDQGFDVNIGGNDLGQPPSYFDPYKPSEPREFYEITTLEPRKEGEFLTDREGDEVVNFIEKNSHGPFFVHYAPYAVHTPIMGPPELVEKYESKPKGKQENPVYAALVESVDRNVGKIISSLEANGLREKTMIIFTSDNGGLIGNPDRPITNNSPLRSQKGYPYEGGIRVPTIVSFPGIVKDGVKEESPIISMDWLPTILDMLEQPIPENGLVGKSLKPLLTSRTAKLEDRDLFWHFPHYRGSDVVPYAIIRSRNYKLIYYFDGSQAELYDLKFDLAETNNIINSRPLIATDLARKIEIWLNESGARLPIEKN